MIPKSQPFAKTSPPLCLLIGFSLKIGKNSHRALRHTLHSYLLFSLSTPAYIKAIDRIIHLLKVTDEAELAPLLHNVQHELLLATEEREAYF